MEPTLNPHDPFLAQVLVDPQAMFILWALCSGVCTTADDIRRHLGDQFAIDDLLRALGDAGLIEGHREGGLTVTGPGRELIARIQHDQEVQAPSHVQELPRMPDDVILTVSVPADAGDGRFEVATLPVPEQFVGRLDDLAWMNRALRGQDGPGICVIWGVAGIGKTSLAAVC